jgi:hypothetical protein
MASMTLPATSKNVFFLVSLKILAGEKSAREYSFFKEKPLSDVPIRIKLIGVDASPETKVDDMDQFLRKYEVQIRINGVFWLICPLGRRSPSEPSACALPI